MTVRLGGGQAGYGDDLKPLVALLASGIDYLVCDALAEATLTVLQKDRQRNEEFGYTRDVTRYVDHVAPYLARGTKFITNAGGLNAVAATREVVRHLRELGVEDCTVATVVGDDVHGREELQLGSDVAFARAYLGAAPIVSALEQGADIVITGRVADASLFLAPLMFEFGWRLEDHDLLASGVTIGHLLECSAQCTGAAYSGDWWAMPTPWNVGFPIAEVSPDGSAVITKPTGTGGRVSVDTVREQLLYEVHDPARYLNPDCIADFTSVQLTDLGDDRVHVGPTAGSAPTATYKAVVGRSAGWAGDHVTVYSWPDAEAKARMANANHRRLTEDAGIAVLDWHEEYFGAGAHHLDAAAPDVDRDRRAGWEAPEVVSRLAWRCSDPETATRVAGTRGGFASTNQSPIGRPKRRTPTELFSIEAILIDRSVVDRQVRVEVHDVR